MSFCIELFAFCNKSEVPEAEIARYTKLISPHALVKVSCLKPPSGSYTNKQELMDAEAVILRKRIPEKSGIIALSEEGKLFSGSRGFADWLAKKQQNARPLVFCIGGAYGLSASIKQSAEAIISLSPLTFSHSIAQVVLLEQIYRAFTILTNHPYHK